MKALILVGGHGTRLRPLTLVVPKPIIPFCNKPLIFHQIDALIKIGVNKIVLAISQQPQSMMDLVNEYSKQFNGVEIVFSKEDYPMGTAGPIALAKDLLKGDDPFFVMNSDVICEYPLQELLDFHNNHQGSGSIFVTKVSDPSKYGVVLTKIDGKIEAFIEKPQSFVGNEINAGIYILNPDVLDLIPCKNCSIEKEIFPLMVKNQRLYSLCLNGFWMDVGQAKDYLAGQGLYLQNKTMIHESTQIGQDCEIGPNVCIGSNCKIETGVRICNSTIMDNTIIKCGSMIKNSIIGWSCHIGKWNRIEGFSVLSQDVVVDDEIIVNGGVILPNKRISENILKSKIVM